MAMDRETAQKIAELFCSASDLCDKSLRTVMANESIGQATVYGRLVGEFMGYTYTNVLAPIWRQFPDLEPKSMREPYAPPEPKLSLESQQALKLFLGAARTALELAINQAGNVEATQSFGYGGLSEVDSSIEQIDAFLKEPRFHD